MVCVFSARRHVMIHSAEEPRTARTADPEPPVIVAVWLPFAVAILANTMKYVMPSEMRLV